jgi:uncharacterized membrane protein SpoIIM required for sporulation
LVFVALLYVGSYLVGWYLISIKSPIAVQIEEALMEAVFTEQPFTSVIESLLGGQLVNAILMTFLVNLTAGAFLTTTLPGTIPLIGAFVTIAVTLFRGFGIGVTYPAVLGASPVAFVLGLGTLILELSAYVFSGAVGINIALSAVFPKRYKTGSRWLAFKMAWKDAARIYLFVILLLALGAIWEMTGLFLVLQSG